jgi:tetratricopeptide (TPR) repeat protein
MVEATRLRRAVERYYATAGASDPIIIDLPRGSYVPTFRRREIAVSRPAQLPNKFARSFGIVPCAAGHHSWRCTSLIIVVAAIGILLRQVARPTASDSIQRAGNGLPIVVIAPLAVAGLRRRRNLSHGAAGKDARRLCSVRNSKCHVRTEGACRLRCRIAPGEARPIIASKASSIICTTARRRSGSALDMQDGADVWSMTFERVEPKQDANAVEESIVRATASTLLQPFGVIHARSGSSTRRPGRAIRAIVAFWRRRVIAFVRSRPTFARASLSRAAHGGGAKFALGFRYLAVIYLRGYQFGTSTRPGGGPTLDQALQFGRRAVELQPESSRGYNTLASIYLASGEIAQAFAASDRAVALNIYDTGVLGDYGGRMIAAGEIDRGIALLRRAADSGTVRPDSHHFYLFLGQYLKGDWADAAYQANQLTSNTNPLGLLARALTAAQMGDREKALQVLDRLVVLRPAWRDNPREQLEKLFPTHTIVERLTNDLIAAGLGATRDVTVRADIGTLPSGNGMPTIYIEPFRVTGTPTARSVAATLLFEKINDAFARFDTVNVVIGSRQQVTSLSGSSGDVTLTEPRADYRLSGALEYRDGKTNVQFRLIDSAESKVVWSRVRRCAGYVRRRRKEQIVISIANALLQSYGVIRARDRAKHLARTRAIRAIDASWRRQMPFVPWIRISASARARVLND